MTSCRAWLMVFSTSVCSAWRPTAITRSAVSCADSRRVPTPLLLGRRPPQEILDKLQPGWRGDYIGSDREIADIWFAFEKVYGSRDKALAASRKNSQVLLPFINSPETILGAHAALISIFGKAGAADIIEKNPGVLACDPQSLAKTSADEIRNAANFVATFDLLPENVKQGIPFFTWILLVGGIGSRLVACSGGACSSDQWDLKGGLGPQLVEFIKSSLPL